MELGVELELDNCISEYPFTAGSFLSCPSLFLAAKMQPNKS